MLFDEEVDPQFLQEINGVKLTLREVDIVSCLLSGKTPQAIANFLSSSSRPLELVTVNTHIANIKRKIDGNARGSIIDFVEKSEKYQFLVLLINIANKPYITVAE